MAESPRRCRRELRVRAVRRGGPARPRRSWCPPQFLFLSVGAQEPNGRHYTARSRGRGAGGGGPSGDHHAVAPRQGQGEVGSASGRGGGGGVENSDTASLLRLFSRRWGGGGGGLCCHSRVWCDETCCTNMFILLFLRFLILFCLIPVVASRVWGSKGCGVAAQ